MKALQEIAQATSPISICKLLSGSSKAPARGSLIYRLYKYLREDKYEEAVIVKKLYGEGTKVTDGRYRTLKSRLKKVMLDSLLNSEVMGGSFKTYDEALLSGYQQLYLARILVLRRSYEAAIEVARNAFKNVRHYEIIPLNEGLTDVLSALHLGIMNNPKLFRKYNSLHEHYSKALFDYSRVSNKYRQLRSKVYAHQDSPHEIGRLKLEFVEESREVMENYLNVPPLQAMIRVTEMIGLKMTGRYNEAMLAGDVAEEVLRNCKGVSKLTLSGMAVMQLECAVNLRDFDLGVVQVEKARQLIPEGTINSIKVSEYAVLLGLQTGHYDYSYQQIINLDRQTLAKLPNEQVAEYWHILEAYIRFLVLAGRINLMEGDHRLTNFRLAKFMNNVPSYVANKFGMNIQILVLQAMFFIVRGELQKFVDRTDSLTRYCNRYLKDNENLRHNCFFRLLIEVVKGGFDLSQRKRQINNVYSRLISKEAVEISRETNSEIVPYEVLWEILVENLKRHRVAAVG